MSRVPARAPQHTLEVLVPYQRVALRVISQAFRDLERPGLARAARAFLAGSPMLRHWCALAALDANRISAKAQAVAAMHEARWSRRDGPIATRRAPESQEAFAPRLLRQLGATPAGTDLVTFLRERGG